MAATDFSLAFEGWSAPDGPWAHLQVVRVRGREAISEPYRYEITAVAKAPAPEIDPSDLVHRRATLRIRTQSKPELKVLHAVVVEAEELYAVPGGQAYRLVLMPPWARAKYRRRCRIFLDKTPREIVEAALRADPRMQKADGASVEEDDGLSSYEPAQELFTWRVQDGARLDDRRVRAYCVQYDESDFDFVSRILEEEGISYHFENGAGACLLVLADHDGGRPRLGPSDAVGPDVAGREVTGFALGARMRPEGVAFDDYDWKKPELDLRASAGRADDFVEAVYPGWYVDAPGRGEPLARARNERLAAEARYASGRGKLRVLSAASVFALDHGDDRHDGEYVVTELEVRGEQAGVLPLASLGGAPEPFQARFSCLRRGTADKPEDSRFRPARATPRPRVPGAQTAVVTAEPGSGAEVNVGGPDGLSIGCVRVKFHWDQDTERHQKEPTSCWVRVSQVFAGAGEGAVFHPRVGVEVIVEHEEGNPDRPVVTGRLYNGQNLPPYGGLPVHSTFKSLSTPLGGAHNELSFDDTAGGELLFLHAGKDHVVNVGNDRAEHVASNAKMKVGSHDFEEVGADCTVTIGASSSLDVGASQSIDVGGNSSTLVGANSDKTVGASETLTVGGAQTITVGSTLTETVGGAVTESYGATRSTLVAAAATETFAASRFVNVAGAVSQAFGSHAVTIDGARFLAVGGNLTTETGGAVTQTYGGSLFTVVAGAQKTTASGDIVRDCPFYIVIVPLAADFDAFKLDVEKLSVSAVGVERKLVGVSKSASGLKLDLAGTRYSAYGVYLQTGALALYPIGGLTASAVGLYVCLHGISVI